MTSFSVGSSEMEKIAPFSFFPLDAIDPADLHCIPVVRKVIGARVAMSRVRATKITCPYAAPRRARLIASRSGVHVVYTVWRNEIIQIPYQFVSHTHKFGRGQLIDLTS